MRVLLLNQFFHPDLSATAQIATDLAEDLAAQGFEVTALASQGSYLGGGKRPARETYRGVNILRVPCTSFGKGSIARRVLDYGSFYASAALRVAIEERPEVVIAMSTPPLVASIGAGLKAARGTRFVYWVQDLYPELAVEFGVLGARSVATRGFDLVARSIVRAADANVVLGEAMGERLAKKGAAKNRIHVIPNWADASAVAPLPPEANPFRKEHGLDGKKVVLYSGNMGRGHDMRTLLAAADRLRERDDLVFLFIGEGAKKGEVEAAARTNPRVRLLPYQPRERLSESLSAGDVHVVTQDASTEGLIEPSKLYGILAAGRPVLYVGPGGTEVARTIRKEQVGRVVANGDVPAVISAVEALFQDARSLGNRAREAAVAVYDRHRRTQQFADLLTALR